MYHFFHLKESTLTLIALIATSVITVATSKGGNYHVADGDSKYHPVTISESEATQRYWVASNCPNAIQQEQIIVSNRLIVEPPQTHFNQFGLPINKLPLFKFEIAEFENSNPREIFEGWIENQLRTCSLTPKMVNQEIIQVFTCYENNQPLCQVTFEIPEYTGR